MNGLSVSIAAYVWVLLLVFLWGRKNAKKLGVITAVMMALVVSVLFYLPILWFWILYLVT